MHVSKFFLTVDNIFRAPALTLPRRGCDKIFAEIAHEVSGAVSAARQLTICTLLHSLDSPASTSLEAEAGGDCRDGDEDKQMQRQPELLHHFPVQNKTRRTLTQVACTELRRPPLWIGTEEILNLSSCTEIYQPASVE